MTKENEHILISLVKIKGCHCGIKVAATCYYRCIVYKECHSTNRPLGSMYHIALRLLPEHKLLEVLL